MTSRHRSRRVALALAMFMGLALLGIGVGVVRVAPTATPVAATPALHVVLAPSLALPATDGHMLSLPTYRGHPVVLFFYEAAT